MSVNLKEKYPKIFKDIHWANYGFPETWTSLVDQLCQEIQDYCDLNKIQVKCDQVKEKFGGLRFYVDVYTEGIDSIISKYEKQSTELCQECGCTNCELVRTKGWISYLCNPCAIKLNKDVE